MLRQTAGSLILLVGICGFAAGQVRQETGSHYLEIRLPPEVKSQTVFIRYILDGDELGGWVEQRPNVISYLIETTRVGRPALRIKAILYAAGCAIQTLDLPLSGLNNDHYIFVCQALRNVPIAGVVSGPNPFFGHEVTLHATYVARWAQPFMRPADALMTTIPVGDEVLTSTDGRFLLTVPDLVHDPLAGAPDHAGEFQIWARDRSSGALIAELVPSGPPELKMRMGGLKIQTQYPAEVVFTACGANQRRRRDAEGFAIRSDPSDPCAADPAPLPGQSTTPTP